MFDLVLSELVVFTGVNTDYGIGICLLGHKIILVRVWG